MEAFLLGESTPWEAMLKASIGLPSMAEKFRHSGWWKIRETIKASMYRTRQSDSRIRSFCTCGRAAWVQTAIDDPTRVRVVQNNCHDRLCTPCANTRSWKIREALMKQLDGRPSTFITLTLCGKNESLVDLVDRLYKSFRALRVHPTWAEKVHGGAAMLEIKWSDKAQRWHPHLHIICEAKFIDQGELSSVWRGITKDSYIVDIRRVKNTEVTASYVCKYASKPLNMSFVNSPKLLDDAMNSLRGRRLCLTFGSWYGTRLTTAEDEELADDLVDAHGWNNFLPLDTLLDRWARGDQEARTMIVSAGLEARLYKFAAFSLDST